jgi:hypothetical protein
MRCGLVVPAKSPRSLNTDTPSGVFCTVSDVRLPRSPEPPPTDDIPLPRLADCRVLMDELGVKKATAERIMRWCSVKVLVGRRVFVYRAEVARVLRSREVREGS